MNLDKLQETIDTCHQATKVDPENLALNEILKIAEDELKSDNMLPADHPFRQKLQDLFASFDKYGRNIKAQGITIRHITENFRAAHASKEMNGGTNLITVPYDQLITLELVYKTKVGLVLHEKELHKKLNRPVASFMACYYLLDMSLDKEERWYSEFVEMATTPVDNFPIFFE